MERTSLRWVAGKRTKQKIYITRVFNYGTLEEWRAMKKRYSRKTILETLTDPLRGQWTPRAKAFAETMFGIKMPNTVLISYNV